MSFRSEQAQCVSPGGPWGNRGRGACLWVGRGGGVDVGDHLGKQGPVVAVAPGLVGQEDVGVDLPHAVILLSDTYQPNLEQSSPALRYTSSPWGWWHVPYHLVQQGLLQVAGGPELQGHACCVSKQAQYMWVLPGWQPGSASTVMEWCRRQQERLTFKEARRA